MSKKEPKAATPKSASKTKSKSASESVTKPDSQTYLYFERGKLDYGSLDGYVFDYSQDWTLLQTLDTEYHLDGYSVFRNEDVKAYGEILETSLARRAVHGLGQEPVPLEGFDLTSLATVLRSAHAVSPIVGIHCERKDRDSFWLGTITKLGRKNLRLLQISRNAKVSKIKRLKLDDITRISFSDRYEKAIWAALSDEGKQSLAEASLFNQQAASADESAKD